MFTPVPALSSKSWLLFCLCAQVNGIRGWRLKSVIAFPPHGSHWCCMWFAHGANQPCPATVSFCSACVFKREHERGCGKVNAIFNYHYTSTHNHQLPVSDITLRLRRQSFESCRVEDEFKWVSTSVADWDQNSNKPSQCWYSFRGWNTLNADWWDCSDLAWGWCLFCDSRWTESHF